MKPLIKKIIIGLVLLAIGVLAWVFLKPADEVEYITEDASIRDIEQIISVNGTVESHSKIVLRFQQAGKIEQINYEVGDKVEENDVLASLENDKLEIDVDKAKAQVAMVKAELDLKYAGPSNSEIRISQTRIDEAEIQLNNARLRLSDTLLSNNENIRQANLSVDNATIALKNAEDRVSSQESSGENTTQIAEQNLKNAYDSISVAVSASLDSIQNAISAADVVLGIDDRAINDLYESLLIGKDPLFEIAAKQNYARTKEALSQLSESHSEFKELPKKSDEEEIPDPVEQEFRQKGDAILLATQSGLRDAKDLLDSTYLVLEKMSFNSTFTSEDRNLLQGTITPHQTIINSEKNSIESIIQNIRSLKLQITSAELSTGTSLQDLQAALEKAQNDLKIAQSNLRAAEVQNEINIHNAQMEIDIREVLLSQARASYANLVADPRFVDVAGIHAKLDNAKADLKKAQKFLEDSLIIAPLNGIITKVDINKGENISTIDEAIVMITDKLQLKANISETDINKISIGDSADITFDSFPVDRIFKAKVISINPAETVIQGVIYYEATVVLETDDPQIRSGMTADIDILTAEATSVLAIPALSIEYKSNEVYVYILKNGEKERRTIKVGIEGDTHVEVLEGLKVGEKVIIYEK